MKINIIEKAIRYLAEREVERPKRREKIRNRPPPSGINLKF